MIKADFYDIESLYNLFTLANFCDDENPYNTVLEIYYIFDDKQSILGPIPNWEALVTDRIYQKNLNFCGKVLFFDLTEQQNAERLARTFGLSDARFMNDPNEHSNYRSDFRIVCDTDPEYDPEKHPYFFGYNSYNYDTTMLAHYFAEAWHPSQRHTIKDNKPGTAYECTFSTARPSAEDMRGFNDKLFEKENKGNMSAVLATTDERGMDYGANEWKIRKNMMMSGRHIDVARLNEKMKKVALKRLLGMLGYQILESSELGGDARIHTFEEFADLLAYNVSDVVNLKALFYHDLYQSQFELKRGLLTTYPELVYHRLGNEYKPDIRPSRVRSDRLCIDSSSAQFATKSLCPYDNLTDIPRVSFTYPTANQAAKMGIKPVDVLDELKKFFYSLYPQPELRAEFDRIYNFYDSIRGKNFNSSSAYREMFDKQQTKRIAEAKTQGLKEDTPEYAAFISPGPNDYTSVVTSVNDIEKANTCLYYYDHDGNPTSCFVLFGIGGIHGAEYNKALYEADLAAWENDVKDLIEVKQKFPSAVDLRKAKTVVMDDGRELPYKLFLKGSRKIADSEYKDIESKKPLLFKPTEKGGYELNKKYVYTSCCKANHEDFTSYYPNLLRRMEAFYNEGLGYDRYADIFDQKQDYGYLMKHEHLDDEAIKKYAHRRLDNVDKTSSEVSASERSRYSNMREGTKLILNSASGAANATFENNIRVDNQIISMRIIGQIFSYRIGQAQSFEGAVVPSTNTDGLYSVMEETKNNQILEREAANIGVDIEPEPLYLISKDSNNRIEAVMDDNGIIGKIISASGGSVGCRKGPYPGKSLAHPAIIDWALTEYLVVTAQNYKGLNMDAAFDREIGMNILKSAFHKFEPVKLLNMYQTILASSPGSITYIYGMRDGEDEPIVLQHYNRAFIMKDGTPDTMHLQAAAARKVTPAMKKKRNADGLRATIIPKFDKSAVIPGKVLTANGEDVNALGKERDIVSKKVTGFESEWSIRIENHSLYDLTTPQRQEIMDNLDLEKYLQMLDDSYTHNWRNKTPDCQDFDETSGTDADSAEMESAAIEN